MKRHNLFIAFIVFICFKLLWFDFEWSLISTFSSFSFIQGYFIKFIIATLLTIPLMFIRSRWYVVVISTLLDLLLVANLMYFRTYFTAIPFESYFIASNLADFKASVFASLDWGDILFPLSTVGYLYYIRKDKFTKISIQTFKTIIKGVGISVAVVTSFLIYHGGFKKAYDYLLFDYHTCGTPIYSVFGSLYYEHLKERIDYTPEIKKEIEDWLAEHKKYSKQNIPFHLEVRNNAIIILAESFESWVLEKEVEGQELTPNLNRYLKKEDILYAPYVLSQVKGSRSIDGQLLMHTGLMPINFGTYSVRFPHHKYYSLDKAFKQKHSNGLTCCFTVDKRVVWNVEVVAQDFGYDVLRDKKYWKLDEKTGPRHRLGDISFLRQCAEVFENDTSIYDGDKQILAQCVTYSGHSPFIIPEESKQINFSDNVPTLLANYMTVANYTDRAIGLFLDRILSQEKFKNTMIIITGDHEGFGARRKKLYEDKVGHNIISPNKFTPLLVINSPVTMRYEKVLGQADIYPTLLDLLGCNNYPWRGMGQSILDPTKKGFAVSPQMEVIGDTTGVDKKELEHALKAYDISDLIICCDYFAKENLE